MQARLLYGTSYTWWKYSEQTRFSSGTMPLIAVTMNFSDSRVRSFFRWFFRYGDGVTNTSVSYRCTMSLRFDEKYISSMLKCTLVR